MAADITSYILSVETVPADAVYFTHLRAVLSLSAITAPKLFSFSRSHSMHASQVQRR